MIQIKNISIDNETSGDASIGKKIDLYGLTILSQELANELEDRGIVANQIVAETGIKLSKIAKLIIDQDNLKAYTEINYIDYFGVSQTIKDIFRNKGFEADVLLNNVEIEEYY